MKELVKTWDTKVGLKAWIFLVRNSHHCGYVAVPSDLPDTHINVHGGVTYDGYPKWANGDRVLGFDCAHAGDACFGYQEEGDIWRDESFCIDQCEKWQCKSKH